MKIILEAKREIPMIRVRLLKRRRREVKVDPKLGGPWKDPKLGGHWNVKDKHLFTPSIFPQQLYLHPQFFPLTSRFYFTMVLSRYSRLSFLFFEL
jgi:hypothetical protein